MSVDTKTKKPPREAQAREVVPGEAPANAREMEIAGGAEELARPPEDVKLSRLVLPAFKRQHAIITLIGTAPLLVHAWSEKARNEMLRKQMGLGGKAKREPKNPIADFLGSLYTIGGRFETPAMPKTVEEDFTEAADAIIAAYVKGGGRFGFPVIASKASAVRAGSLLDLKMTETRQRFRVHPTHHVKGMGLVEIKGPPPRMVEHAVKIMRTSDLRYRGEFPEGWRMEIPVSWIENFMDEDQLGTLLRYAGECVGIGEWRLEKNGSHGAFDVEKIEIARYKSDK